MLFVYIIPEKCLCPEKRVPSVEDRFAGGKIGRGGYERQELFGSCCRYPQIWEGTKRHAIWHAVKIRLWSILVKPQDVPVSWKH